MTLNNTIISEIGGILLISVGLAWFEYKSQIIGLLLIIMGTIMFSRPAK